MRCSNPFAFRPGPVTFWTTAVYLAIAIPLLYVHETVPPAPSQQDLHRGLNLTEAWIDLETLTAEYHPYNTHANDVVRGFLLGRFGEILERNGVEYGMEVMGRSLRKNSSRSAVSINGVESRSTVDQPRAVIFDDQLSNVTWTQDLSGSLGTNIGPASWIGQYFEGNNIYVYIRGQDDPEGEWWNTESSYKKAHGKGGVLVNCHFDSVSTGYGATDDGMSCVVMLQLLSYFTSSDVQPKNGIVLLFNNAEEPGLLGAKAFGNSPLVEFCHTFVNLEGAGAGGRAVLFRTTDLEIAKAYSGSSSPFGSVLAADAFKKGVIKSGTDYQIFADIYGQRGMDIAFYAPRARYHTEDDDTRHTSTDSIWHMLSATIAATKSLAHSTGDKFSGPRADGAKHLAQNGKPTEGVWFDLLGTTWVAFALRGLFAWSLTLLVATPLVLFLVMYLLMRKGKFYFFSGDVRVRSNEDYNPVKIGGWRGFFRFPVAFGLAGGLTMASTYLLAKFNPFIVYSSSYAVWAMTLSLFYSVFWVIVRGASYIRPSALHRGFVFLWLFVMGWALQVMAAVAEDRMHIGSFYFSVFLQSAIFLALLISFLEQCAFPGKRQYAQEFHDANRNTNHQAEQDHGGNAEAEGSGESDGDDDDQATPTETTPLRSGENSQSHGTTFGNGYRRAANVGPTEVEIETAEEEKVRPYDLEQIWSWNLPSWTWLLQLLLVAPLPLLVIGNLGLFMSSSLQMTGTDGGNLLLPFLGIGMFSIIFLMPLTPFLHRVTPHIPLFCFVVFFGTFIYNLVVFPFSSTHRFKFNFQQVVDLDYGTNKVTLTGIEDYLRTVIDWIPAAAGQEIKCHATNGRDLMDCDYDASSVPPNLVEGTATEDLISMKIAKSSDGLSANILLDAEDTRMCYLRFSEPIYTFEVEGGQARDPRFGPIPDNGLQMLEVWRRDRSIPWNITVALSSSRNSLPTSQHVVVESSSEEEEEGGLETDELKIRSGGGKSPKVGSLRVTARCAWSDANVAATTIPALHQLKRYIPEWAVVSKRSVGLVEVRKTYEI